MGMIVIMIRWVCSIAHAFRPATPPAHDTADAPGRRQANKEAATTTTMAGQLAGYRWAKNRPPT